MDIKRHCRIISDETAENIFLTGNLSNPYAVLQECDCFILPSLYEGQPMVIHEARILHKPILMTDFSTSASSMIDNGQTIIRMDVDGIYEGLCAFIEGGIRAEYTFDPKEYDKEAYNQFLRVIVANNGR